MFFPKEKWNKFAFSPHSSKVRKAENGNKKYKIRQNQMRQTELGESALGVFLNIFLALYEIHALRVHYRLPKGSSWKLNQQGDFRNWQKILTMLWNDAGVVSRLLKRLSGKKSRENSIFFWRLCWHFNVTLFNIDEVLFLSMACPKKKRNIAYILVI